jgi:hypothetical protein
MPWARILSIIPPVLLNLLLMQIAALLIPALLIPKPANALFLGMTGIDLHPPLLLFWISKPHEIYASLTEQQISVRDYGFNPVNTGAPRFEDIKENSDSES